MTRILVFVEQSDGAAKRASLEALGAARAVSEEITAVLFGPGAGDVAASLGNAGAERAVVLGGSTESPDTLAKALADVVREQGAVAFLASATSTGRDLAPRVAAHLDVTPLSECTGFEADGAGYAVQRPLLAGKLIARLAPKGPVVVATLRRNMFAPFAGSGNAEVVDGPEVESGRITITGVEAKEGGKLDVSEAPIVVSGGRGLKESHNFSLIEELASAFGTAAVGASRAVVDAGWRPHAEQVGQTGKTVSPQLYVAVGISGAIQHLAGMKTSKVIVAINKDAEAPIFKIADYGVVGDAFEILPVLTEKVRQIRAEG